MKLFPEASNAAATTTEGPSEQKRGMSYKSQCKLEKKCREKSEFPGFEVSINPGPSRLA